MTHPPERQDPAAQGTAGDSPADHSLTDARKFAVPKAAGGLGRSVAAGLAGETVSAKGVLEAIGGVRGIVESLLPGMLYLVVFVFTQNPYISVIGPAALALIATAWRLIGRQPLATALAGLIGVGICVATTLVTGEGTGYFLPGFWINGAWSVGLLISLLVGWPLLGFIVGALRGDLTGWRKDRAVRRAALLCTAIWLLMFLARLAVQLPLYVANATEALGIARLVMGVPLYGLLVLFTWLILRAAIAKNDTR